MFKALDHRYGSRIEIEEITEKTFRRPIKTIKNLWQLNKSETIIFFSMEMSETVQLGTSAESSGIRLLSITSSFFIAILLLVIPWQVDVEP
jgi:hypothetical protein